MHNLTRTGRRRRKLLLPAILVAGALDRRQLRRRRRQLLRSDHHRRQRRSDDHGRRRRSHHHRRRRRSDDDGGRAAAAPKGRPEPRRSSTSSSSGRRASISTRRSAAEIPTGQKIYFISCGVDVCEAEADMASRGDRDPGLGGHQAQHRRQPAVRAERLGAGRPGEAGRRDVHGHRGARRSSSTSPQAAANGTSIAACCITDDAERGERHHLDDVDAGADRLSWARPMAAWVVNDAAENGNDAPGMVYLDVPDFPILTALGENTEKTFKELCPDCAYETLSFGLADLADGQRQRRVVPAVEPGHEVRHHVDRRPVRRTAGGPQRRRARRREDLRRMGPSLTNQANIAAGDRGRGRWPSPSTRSCSG